MKKVLNFIFLYTMYIISVPAVLLCAAFDYGTPSMNTNPDGSKKSFKEIYINVMSDFNGV